MREIDLIGLAEEIGDTAPQPPFTIVERRAGRLRGRRRLAVASGVLGVLVAVSLGGYAVARPHDTPVQVGITPSPAADRPERIHSADAGDADHLYAVVADCVDCPVRLMASDDRGRSWQERPAYADIVRGAGSAPSVSALGPRVLTYGLDTELTGSTEKAKISLDGGATWRDQRVSHVPVPRAPAGTRLVTCRPYGPGERCGLFAVDPATGVFAPLAQQPPLTDAHALPVPPAAGLWAQGQDPATNRPAVAVSRDLGRTWDVGVFTAEPAVPEGGAGSPPIVATTDGQTAWASAIDPDGRKENDRIYRSTNGGRTWERTNVDGPPAGLPLLTTVNYVTADGAHVVASNAEGDSFRLRVSTDGRRYEPLPAPKISIPPVAIGRDAFMFLREQIYLSSDGRTWHATTPPWRR